MNFSNLCRKYKGFGIIVLVFPVIRRDYLSNKFFIYLSAINGKVRGYDKP